jgi:hypothetical protein
LAIEVFGCLHKQVDVFLHNYVNVIWSFKGLKGPPLPILVTFLCQKISITLQRMQASSILSWAIAIGLATFQLPPMDEDEIKERFLKVPKLESCPQPGIK